MAKKANEIVPLQVRMRRGLLEKMQADARKQEHSLNSEIIGRLEGSYDDETRAFDFQTAVAAISGGGDNAQLLSMISTALLLSAPNTKTDTNTTVENMDAFACACSAIIAAHGGKPLQPIPIDKLFELRDSQHRGYIIAQAILLNHDLPSIIDAPPMPDQPELSLATLGRHVSAKPVLGTHMSLADLARSIEKKRGR